MGLHQLNLYDGWPEWDPGFGFPWREPKKNKKGGFSNRVGSPALTKDSLEQAILAYKGVEEVPVRPSQRNEQIQFCGHDAWEQNFETKGVRCRQCGNLMSKEFLMVIGDFWGSVSKGWKSEGPTPNKVPGDDTLVTKLDEAAELLESAITAIAHGQKGEIVDVLQEAQEWLGENGYVPELELKQEAKPVESEPEEADEYDDSEDDE